MKKPWKYLLIAFVVLTFVFPLIAGKNSFKMIFPKDLDRFGIEFINTLHEGDIEEIKPYLDEQTEKTVSEATLKELIKFAKVNEIRESELIGYHFSSVNGITESKLTYETKFNNEWALITMTLVKNGSTNKVASIFIQPIKEPLSKVNGFSLLGKPLICYVFIGIMGAIAIFIIWAAVLCMNSDIKKKWLWVAFTLTGVCIFSINWTTGAWGINPISFNIPSLSYARDGMYAPWILSFNIPLGAVIFLFKRKSLMASYEKELEMKEFEKNEMTEALDDDVPIANVQPTDPQ